MSDRFTSTIDLMNGADLVVKAGDTFELDPANRPGYLQQNTHYIRVGIIANPGQVVEDANKLSSYLMERAIAYYRGHKMPEPYKEWQNREKLNPDIAQTIWNYYKKKCDE